LWCIGVRNSFNAPQGSDEENSSEEQVDESRDGGVFDCECGRVRTGNVALVVATTQAATFVGAIAGAMWMVKSVENVSLDTRLKTLQIQAMQDGFVSITKYSLQMMNLKRSSDWRSSHCNSNYRVE
jgi:hypothetical protein